MATWYHKEVNTQNLACPICLTMFTEPRSLLCSHTFCKGCLQRILVYKSSNHKIACPVCKLETPVIGRDASMLPTNVAMDSLIDNVKTGNPICMNCPSEENIPAVAFCRNCGKNLCDSCQRNHAQWRDFASHGVVDLKDVAEGKGLERGRRKCESHPSEYKELFCSFCRCYVCFRCAMLEHKHDGHQLKQGTAHEETIATNIERLKARASTKKSTLNKFIRDVDKQPDRINDCMKELNASIDEAYNDVLKQLAKRREELKTDVQKRLEAFAIELRILTEDTRKTITDLNGAEGLVSKGLHVQLENDYLSVHETLCESLEIILNENDPDGDRPAALVNKAEKIYFRRNEDANVLDLGKLKEGKRGDKNANEAGRRPRKLSFRRSKGKADLSLEPVQESRWSYTHEK